MKIYFDNAATTCLDKEVLDAMLPFMQEHYGNPSSIHSFGRYTRAGIEAARKTIARLLHVSPAEIFFTSGGTEADNMAISCCIHDHKLTHAITTRIEHHAVLHTLEALEAQGSIKLSFVNVDAHGNIDLEQLEELLVAHSNSLVSLMHANNELGNLLPMDKVSELCRKYKAMFHSDTVQTIGHYKLDLKALDVDFINGAAHKFHGPKGVGFIYINGNVKINPLLFGGSQERNMRGGTENLYGIIGLAKAMEIAYRDMDVNQHYIQGIKDYMITRLSDTIPNINFNGNTLAEKSLYTILNVQLPPHDSAEMMLFNLDIAGIAASGGSACTSGSNQGSHVLRGIGADVTRPSIRFSFSKYNTREEVDYTVAKLADLYATKIKV